MELIPPNTKIDFLGNRKYAYLFSILLTIAALMSIPIKGGLVMGIDFSGGASVQIRFNKPVDTGDVRSALNPLGEAVIVQKFASSDTDFVVRLEVSEKSGQDIGRHLKELLEAKTGKDSVEIRGVDMVGPKVGKDLRTHAVLATIIALIFLLIYMAFRFTFIMGLGAVLCLVHDVLVVYGFFVWTGKEFNLTILAAMLTIVGYDINDTIVVCDRIREDLKIMKKVPLIDIMNQAINQTLSRTILTTLFTSLVVIALLIFGTSMLRDFAWALLVGMIIGTYSSIFVATPLVLELDKIMPIKR